MSKQSTRRRNKSFFLNIAVALLLGAFSDLVAGWRGILVAVVGYVAGGLVVLVAAAEQRSHEIEDQRQRLEEELRGFFGTDRGQTP